MRQFILDGADSFSSMQEPAAIVGVQIANSIGVSPEDPFSKLELHYPNAKQTNMAANPLTAFQTLRLSTTGTFSVQEEFDRTYVLVPLPLAQGLFNEAGKLSAIDLKLAEKADADEVSETLQMQLGKAFKVETRYQQNRDLYSIMKIEKWSAYAILLFVLLIASITMIGALSLLVLEKKKDMAILGAMGILPVTIRRVFLAEGVLWSAIGGGSGLLLGGVLCLLQQQFGLVKLEGLIIDAYPVQMLWTDFAVVLVTVCAVGLLAAWFPVQRGLKLYKRQGTGWLG